MRMGDRVATLASSSGFDVAGAIGLVAVLAGAGLIAATWRTWWLARAPRLALASSEEAASFRQGALAFGAGRSRHEQSSVPRKLRRWWAQGYRDAKRFGTDYAIGQLDSRQ